MDMLKTLRSATITKRPTQIPAATVGEILLEEFLKPMALSQNALARAIKVPPRRINEIVLGKRAVSADTDLRLARYFGMSDGFFLRVQMDYDLRVERRALEKKLMAIKPRAA
jgi:antitoxin HigA-1